MDDYNLLTQLGIPIAEGHVVKDKESAANVAEEIGFPVALKIISRDILHKTEANGVWLDINSTVDVQNAFDTIMENAVSYKKDVKIEGVLVQKFYQDGAEVILGLTRDDVFGYALMFGLGGIFTEVLRDVTYRIAPINEKDAMEMIKEINGYPVLMGTRGGKHKDVSALAKTLAAFSRLGELQAVKEAEINPLLVFENGVVAVDVRILKD